MMRLLDFRTWVFASSFVFTAALSGAQPFGEGPNVNLKQKSPLQLYQAQEHDGPIIIRTSTVLDGRGGVLNNQDLYIEGGKIVKIAPHSSTPATYDLRGLTVTPGWIDTHAHAGHFDFDGRAHREPRWRKSWMTPPPEESEQELTLFALEGWNAALLAGFTTVQTFGNDALTKKFEERGFPVPRIVTSLGSVNYYQGTPEEIREWVRDRVKMGADVIKVRASASIRGVNDPKGGDSGRQLMTYDQIFAACDEATKHGLRSVVHVQNESSTADSVRAGCTSMEHGVRISDATLDEMKKRGTYFGSHNGLLLENYLTHKQQYVGQDNFTEQGYSYIERGVTEGLGTFKRALAKGVKIIFGTDANAGSIGRNYDEMIWRVNMGGQKPMDVIIAATSLAAESLRMQDKLGSIAPGYEADIVATDGNPTQDITAVRRAMFVMKRGLVFKNLAVRQDRPRATQN